MNDQTVDTRLSYSSATLLRNCSQKYWHHKIGNTPADADSEENMEAFNVGKAFHYVLEENGHTNDRLHDLLDEACKSFDVWEKRPMIHAMLLRYLQVHKASGLTARYCELQIDNPIFIGFIDVILTDDDGNWWIGDLKTSAWHTDITTARLAQDVQLNLYCSFYKGIGEQFDLNPEKFQGAKYLVTTKSKLKQKKTEGYKEFVLRMASGIKSYHITIPHEIMNPDAVYAEHEMLHQRTMAMREGKLKPEKNLSYCDAYFKPCKYWSSCRDGLTYTESLNRMQVLSTETI